MPQGRADGLAPVFSTIAGSAAFKAGLIMTPFAKKDFCFLVVCTGPQFSGFMGTDQVSCSNIDLNNTIKIQFIGKIIDLFCLQVRPFWPRLRYRDWDVARLGNRKTVCRCSKQRPPGTVGHSHAAGIRNTKGRHRPRCACRRQNSAADIIEARRRDAWPVLFELHAGLFHDSEPRARFCR